jgi:predicted sugar kinase
LLIEAGKLAQDEISPLISRIPLPAPWRFVLFWPTDRSGLSGEAELQAFQRLPATNMAATDALCREALLELAPAAVQGEFDRFSESLYRFGRAAGECFAAEQGGTYAGARIAQLVRELRAAGIRGVGQSSWGPTVFALLPNEADARSAAEQFAAPDRGGPLRTLVSACDHRGVQIAERFALE